MDKFIERCVGLDVHRDSVTACVRFPDDNGERRQEIRTFATTTAELLALRDWLAAYQVTVVGMESTGVYWKAPFYLLEEDFTCWLINAQHIKIVPGRKTDVKDAEWICQLVEHGLVRPSFVPPPPIRDLRDLTRYRKALINERTRAVQRLEKVLQDAGIKLSSVASKVLGVSGRAMLEALLAGSTDPEALADLAKGRLRSKIPALKEALRGYFRAHHAVMVGEILAHVDYLEEAIERLSVEIERVIAPFSRQVMLLDTIPGVERRTAEAIIAEIGVDMSRFPSDAHLASWAGMCPGNNDSAGKHRTGKTRKGSKSLRTALVQAANAAARTKNTYLRALYQRIKSRHGHNKAVVAVGHSMLVASFHILSKEVPYQDLGGDYFQTRDTDAHIRRLVRQLERLGQKVNLEPAA
ncbi:MAG: IS110 family transposase [Chloroflexi bacterium]|nr:IS110 family transposase [Chloroflexota bacterium]